MVARNTAWPFLLLASCARSAPPHVLTTPNSKRDCAYQLPPRDAGAERAPGVPSDVFDATQPRQPHREAAERTSEPSIRSSERELSHLVVHLTAPLGRIAAEFEGQVGRQLAAERGVSLGPAGTLDYVVERGPMTLSVAQGKLVVAAPITARAEACSRGRCYAACEPQGLARVEVPLGLRPDYRFHPSRVSFEFTRGCKVRVLGGFLTIDVTATLRSEVERALTRIGRDIDRRLPDLRPMVERAYQDISRSRSFPMGCLQLAPEAVVQGPIEDSSERLHALFALQARPELRTDCETSTLAQPAPPLKMDPELPNAGRVTLGMAIPLSSFEKLQSWSSAAADHPVRIVAAKLASSGAELLADLALQGEVCGPLSMHAQPAFVGDGAFVTLTAGGLSATERARVRSVSVDAEQLVRAVTERLRVPTPVSVRALRAAIPFLASALSDETLAVTVHLESLRAAGASVRSDSVVARVDAIGSVHLELR